MNPISTNNLAEKVNPNLFKNETPLPEEKLLISNPDPKKICINNINLSEINSNNNLKRPNMRRGKKSSESFKGDIESNAQNYFNIQNININNNTLKNLTLNFKIEGGNNPPTGNSKLRSNLIPKNQKIQSFTGIENNDIKKIGLLKSSEIKLESEINTNIASKVGENKSLLGVSTQNKACLGKEINTITNNKSNNKFSNSSHISSTDYTNNFGIFTNKESLMNFNVNNTLERNNHLSYYLDSDGKSSLNKTTYSNINLIGNRSKDPNSIEETNKLFNYIVKKDNNDIYEEIEIDKTIGNLYNTNPFQQDIDFFNIYPEFELQENSFINIHNNMNNYESDNIANNNNFINNPYNEFKEETDNDINYTKKYIKEEDPNITGKRIFLFFFINFFLI